jgi:type II secretory pathway pseudopilin PulG
VSGFVIKKYMKKGFTLVEIVIVVGLIIILASVAFVALNPAKRLADSRNANRQISIKALIESLINYSLEESKLPEGIDENLKMIGKQIAEGCNVSCGEGIITGNYCVDLSIDLAKYFDKLPMDPKGGTELKTFYAVQKLGSTGVKVVACNAEGKVIEASAK